MLTRLKVSGFKNLDVDVSFGPFTCIAGANGTGKSNLFDAIQFLSKLSDHTLLDAAMSVRSEGGRFTEIRHLFHRAGNRFAEQMSFEAEMIVPPEGTDDLGQPAKASITFLRYRLVLSYRRSESRASTEGLEILAEELTHINIGDAAKHLRFPHSPAWRRSVVKGRRTGPLISTQEKDGKRLIKLHQEGAAGRPREYLAETLPRTVLSSANAMESPTTLLARREMQSWRLLQLEPSALRRPDELTAPTRLSMNGAHIPATLNYLAYAPHQSDISGEAIFDKLANRLSELIEHVRSIRVDRDEQRQLLTLEVIDHSGTNLPARALSDGTLRFLALALLALDPRETGLICLEEPENGIHPERIPAMLRLLRDMAVDPNYEVGVDNPLRQVIINTHSPIVVSEVYDDELLVAELYNKWHDGIMTRSAKFNWLPNTWRSEVNPTTPPVARGKLLAYLNPISVALTNNARNRTTRRRVVERPDLQPYLPTFE
ncbi:MAG: AAA family ATPase [Chloroflexus sp.]|nr:AAA family ATPase [Chloroflexus sp.]